MDMKCWFELKVFD